MRSEYANPSRSVVSPKLCPMTPRWSSSRNVGDRSGLVVFNLGQCYICFATNLLELLDSFIEIAHENRCFGERHRFCDAVDTLDLPSTRGVGPRPWNDRKAL